MIQQELHLQLEQPEHIRYHNGQRLISVLQEREPSQLIHTADAIGFKPQGVYLITGGLGGLGLIVADHLAKTYQARLILTGRSELSDEKQEHIKKLEALGAEVLYLQGDVTQLSDVQHWLMVTKTRFGHLNGILHSAGLVKDGLLLNKLWADFEAVMAPKIQGSLNLDSATQHEALDIFILFSSIASVMGNSGQSDYAAANGFLDSFAHWRTQQVKLNQRTGKTLSINWRYGKTEGCTSLLKLKAISTAKGGICCQPSKG